MAGSVLLHTDVNPANVRIGSSAVLVDWAAVGRGAPFVNPCDFVICLIASGHLPGEADYYARTASTAWLHIF
ncbi:hypothetical protein BJF79_08540 [Actinomadura sp. CNU-125]|uniref:hypothetical protein n=1 Tax=Actinomadura sp. CNU-125 TaxID=1904961 RepID=UPI000968DC44|nr:hypothetical protein [Actinomadura sp. CNU-125]OLT31835.1 hypothetical protein BJF79_08540 [Actinomadura sp. CNU-125]